MHSPMHHMTSPMSGVLNHYGAQPNASRTLEEVMDVKDMRQRAGAAVRLVCKDARAAHGRGVILVRADLDLLRTQQRVFQPCSFCGRRRRRCGRCSRVAPA
jgi:hypothetical protein